METKAFLTVNKTLFFTLIFICSLTSSWGQNSAKQPSTYEIGGISKALHASMIPDNRKVGVYLSVGLQNEVPPSEWASTIEKVFTAYGFPVKIILREKRTNGKAAIARIYIGAKAYGGNLSSRNIGLNHLLTNHEKVFAELLDLYKKANPDMTFTQN